MITDFGIDEGAGSFSEGMAVVQVGKKWGFLDTKGKLAIAPQFDFAFNFSEGLAAVGKDQHYRFIDHSGTTVVGSRYSISLGCEGVKFSEGLTAVQIEDECDFIDRTDTVVIHTKLAPLPIVGDFSGGMAKFMTDEKWGYLDKSGKIAIAPKFDYVTDFSLPDRTSRANQF